MKKLLIHTNNTSFNRPELFSISEQYIFDVDYDTDVDIYIDKILRYDDLNRKISEVDIIFIKPSLSNNYLEYFGIRLAYHIRLTGALGSKCNIPIVFITEESIQFLARTYSEPSILFTEGIYFIKEAIEDYQRIINWFNEGLIKPLSNFNIFINAINLKAPANYQSHHSVANEWALVRYFSMFEKDEDNELYNDLREKIIALDYLKTLHFKYNEALISRQKFKPQKHAYTPVISGINSKRIGIIDDEFKKGWYAFYEYLFNKSNAESVAFVDFRKDESREKLIQKIQVWLNKIITSSNPVDLFVIDLRLHDDDFSEGDYDNMTGTVIIKYIKSLNPGIQIVISTASNKVWNYQKCIQLGVNFFAIKESPETVNSREETKNTLNHLIRQITNASTKDFLADIYRKIQFLKLTNNFQNDPSSLLFKELVFDKNGMLDQIMNLLLLDSENNSVINQSLLLAFQILENYCDLNSCGIFDFKNSTGKISQKGNTILLDVFTASNEYILTKLELRRGKFNFQIESSNETIISYEAYDSAVLRSAFSKIDSTTLVKIISVLHFRHKIPKQEIEKVIELRYYRSNVSAHLTGNVKPDFKIDVKSIVNLIDLFIKIFI